MTLRKKSAMVQWCFSARLSWTSPTSHLWRCLAFHEMHFLSTCDTVLIWQQFSSLAPSYDFVYVVNQLPAEISVSNTSTCSRKMCSCGNMRLSHDCCCPFSLRAHGWEAFVSFILYPSKLRVLMNAPRTSSTFRVGGWNQNGGVRQCLLVSCTVVALYASFNNLITLTMEMIVDVFFYANSNGCISLTMKILNPQLAPWYYSE